MSRPAASEAEAQWLPLLQRWVEPVDGAVPQVRWWIEGPRLVWEMRTTLPMAAQDTFKTDGFIEGLWEQDVAEFFIADRRTGHYQEFNLSPGGAWWSAVFSGPRVRIDPQPPCVEFGVETEVWWTETGWTGRIRLPLPDLAHAAVNFTAITAGREGRRFYSLSVLGGVVPDFHRPEEWLPL